MQYGRKPLLQKQTFKDLKELITDFILKQTNDSQESIKDIVIDFGISIMK